jgi:DNA-directed RNA polymerase specialized sigma24 family protein
MNMRQRRRVEVPECVSVGSLRLLNSYESTGYHAAQWPLDEMVLQHLQVQQALCRLDAYQELAARMISEGYTTAEIAAEMNCSPRRARSIVHGIRWSRYGRWSRTA